MDSDQHKPGQQSLPEHAMRLWGPYLSERHWGTVREDYSANGDAWNYFPHDHARPPYRWGEDGLAGISDETQTLCFALALWNGRNPILKERLFGLTNGQGNHGEDVKEYYFYLDGTPSHSYWFPVNFLIIESLQRFHHYYGDDFKVECPAGSGCYVTLDQVAEELTRRLAGIFLKNASGCRQVNALYPKFQKDQNFRDYIPFYEYFDGDTGRGVGASHQTGWTGVIAKLLQPRAG